MLGVLRAAVFAQPPITQVEEVVRFVHAEGDRVWGVGRTETKHPTPKPYSLIYRRGLSGASVSRTGTFILLPPRTISVCTVSPI